MSISSNSVYYYCFYHIFSVKHTNYHHVIMRLTEEELEQVKTLDADSYQYCLISAQPVFLDEEDAAELINRGLIMDGESLLKRFKAQHKKSISTNGHQ
jgi:hypothetical protein